MIDTLILSGGGINGIMLIGVIKGIKDWLPYIRTYIGTSIGAVIATFLSIGYNYDDLYDIVISLNFDDYYDFDINNLFMDYGLDNCNKLLRLFNSIIYCKLNIYNPTFKYLFDNTNKILKMNGSNLTLYTNDIFSYIDTPDMTILDALKISICVPFLYKPVYYNNYTYIDGGMFDNYLINETKNKKYTLGVFLSFFDDKNDKNDKNDKSINNIMDYMNIVINSFYIYMYKYKIIKYKSTTLILKSIKNPINFKLTYNDKNIFINTGYKNVKKFYYKKFKKIQKKRLKQKYFYLLNKNAKIY